MPLRAHSSPASRPPRPPPADESASRSFRGGFHLRGNLAVNHFAHQRRFRGELPVDGRSAVQLAKISAPRNHPHLHFQPIPPPSPTPKPPPLPTHPIQKHSLPFA